MKTKHILASLPLIVALSLSACGDANLDSALNNPKPIKSLSEARSKAESTSSSSSGDKESSTKSSSADRHSSQDTKDDSNSKSRTQSRINHQAIDAQALIDSLQDEYGLEKTSTPDLYRVGKLIPLPEDAANTPLPVYPDGAHENTLDGAGRAAIFFEDMLAYTVMTGDISHWNEICSEESKFCNEFALTVQMQKMDKSWTAAYTVEYNPTLNIDLKGDKAVVAINVHNPQSLYYSAPDKALKVRPARDAQDLIFLSYEDGKWIVHGYNGNQE